MALLKFYDASAKGAVCQIVLETVHVSSNIRPSSCSPTKNRTWNHCLEGSRYIRLTIGPNYDISSNVDFH